MPISESTIPCHIYCSLGRPLGEKSDYLGLFFLYVTKLCWFCQAYHFLLALFFSSVKLRSWQGILDSVLSARFEDLYLHSQLKLSQCNTFQKFSLEKRASSKSGNQTTHELEIQRGEWVGGILVALAASCSYIAGKCRDKSDDQRPEEGRFS